MALPVALPVTVAVAIDPVVDLIPISAVLCRGPARGPARARARDCGRGPWPGPTRARVAPLSFLICHQVFPPNTLFHRHRLIRLIRPVRLTGFQQARQAFSLGLCLYRDCGSLITTSTTPQWVVLPKGVKSQDVMVDLPELKANNEPIWI